MNKTRMILAVTGGVIAVAVLAAGYFLWSAFSAKTAAFEGDDENDGLETVVGQVKALTSKKPFPSDENRKKLEANRTAVVEWYRGVRAVVAEGDWLPDDSCTEAQFKEMIGRDAKAISVATKENPSPLVAADFGFGPFQDYLKDKMPTKEELPRLQRQWYDITSLIRLLSTNGVTRLTNLQVVDRGNAAAEEKGKPKNRKKAKEADANQPSIETYRLSFQAVPAAFAAVVGELSFQKRFTVVESFEFVRGRDTVAEALGGEKKEAAAGAPVGRRRRGAQAAEKAPEQNARGGVVFDPSVDSTLNVEMTVSVYDFRSLESEKGEEKGASK